MNATRQPTVQSTKRLEKALNERDRYRALFEMGPIAVYSCDASGVIDNCNQRAVELWGRDPKPGDTDERFCGSYKLFRPDGTFMAHQETPMAEVLGGTLAEVRDQEVLIERPDGTRVTVLVNIRPLVNERGEITGAINCFYDISERKRLEEALQGSHDDLERTVEQRTAALRQLSAKLMHAQDDERRRISRELHDGISQDLAQAKMSLVALGRTSSAEQSGTLTELINLVQKCFDETRTISYLLHPPLLEELGLKAAVNWYVGGFASRSGIRVKLDFVDGKRLPANLEILLFRILQEGLTNIHRHSHSPSADIRIALGSEVALLEIKDHGQGIPADLLEQYKSGAAGGVGLRSMRERISEVGGQVEIESGSQG
ncbi:MAG TPA: ATP-binding protein, partial [Candidatus Acidoferrum sp.]|nr:ATP-binding protein [Candidatus Acidoferrum sp.]